MTALVIVESGVSLDEKFKVTKEDFVRSSARSKLRNGMYLFPQAGVASSFDEF